jgi:tripartite-type tricarboxylate transporter receptor subunit TctC
MTAAHSSTRSFLSASAAAAIVTASLALPNAARADAVADSYKGRTVTLFVGAGVGGSYDMYARLLAPYLSKHLPGNPTVVVKLILGGGGGLAHGAGADAAGSEADARELQGSK